MSFKFLGIFFFLNAFPLMYINSMYTDLSKKEQKKYCRHIRQEADEKNSPPQTEMGNVILLLCFVNFRFDTTINRIPGNFIILESAWLVDPVF